jgi:hypothetical protein
MPIHPFIYNLTAGSISVHELFKIVSMYNTSGVLYTTQLIPKAETQKYSIDYL